MDALLFLVSISTVICNAVQVIAAIRQWRKAT